MKGLAEKALTMGGGEKKPKGEPEERDGLELALQELFDAPDPKTRAQAFKAAVAMCRGYDDEE